MMSGMFLACDADDRLRQQLGPNNELWTPDMKSLLVECYNAKSCNSVYEITFALSGKFRVGLTDQETYKKLQRMKLEGIVD